MKWTIRKKFFLGFLLLFTSVALTVHQVMERTIETNTMTLLESDLTKLQHTSKEYLKQFSQLHNEEDDLFAQNGSKIAQELSRLHSQSVAIYKTDGHFLYEAVPISEPLLLENQKYQKNLEKNNDKELQAAFNNKAAFTPVKTPGGTIIYFAYPVYIEDTFRGVLRFTGDYTEMFKHNQQLLDSFTILTALLFFGVFIISFLLSNQIIKPLHYLSNAAKRIATGDYSIIAEVKTSDEIGELAKNFRYMQKQINQHIEVIEAEREKVLLLEKKRTAFFHNVTHELKTPLATISGYAQIIGAKDFDDSAFLESAAGKIRTESDRLNEMVVELLSFSKWQSKIEQKQPEIFDLYPLVQSICEEMQMKADHYGMAINLFGTNFIIKGNCDEMRQLFINLIDNSIKHGKPGDPIEINIEEDIKIVNNCDPIPPNIAANTFEPFVHTATKDSYGLGLFICEQIVTGHNGKITFNYHEEQATVMVYLPRQQDGNNS